MAENNTNDNGGVYQGAFERRFLRSVLNVGPHPLPRTIGRVVGAAVGYVHPRRSPRDSIIISQDEPSRIRRY